jgi:hypothetical protein
VAIIVVLSFFVMQLFVGVIIDNFNTMNKELSSEGGALVTKEQKDWIQVQRTLTRITRSRAWQERRPAGWARGHAWDLTERRGFDALIMLCILLNTLLMAAGESRCRAAGSEPLQSRHTHSPVRAAAGKSRNRAVREPFESAGEPFESRH